MLNLQSLLYIIVVTTAYSGHCTCIELYMYFLYHLVNKKYGTLNIAIFDRIVYKWLIVHIHVTDDQRDTIATRVLLIHNDCMYILSI